MALETPIVATDVGGTAELCQPGVHGLVVQPGSAERLSDAIESALADTASTQARAAAARERVVSELSFERRLRRLEDIYERLVRGSR
jgi:glycosyltransferase involved in cell wall biosynthesis